jgi:hypothetical protein
MSNMSDARPSGVSAMFARLVDDAAVFPPGDAPLSEAVPAHAEYLRAWYGDLVGPFVCSDRRLTELQRVVAEHDGLPLRLSLTITGGAGAIEPALIWVSRDDRLELVAVEVAVRDEADLAHNVDRITTVLAGCLPDDAEAFVELPRLYSTEIPAGWAGAMDALSASGHRLKCRTGGLDADAFPSAAELAVVIDAALEREVEFKCTAGLHNAVAHANLTTGFDHHGFLNVLLATRASLDSASPSEVESILAERDPEAVTDRVREIGDDQLTAARRWFRSFGSCSIVEPVDDLVGLGLLSIAEDR